MVDSNFQVIEKFIEAGLDEKQAKLIIDLATQPPSKASEIGKRVGISRMDAYNSLRKLQEQGLIKATLDKPIRFFGMKIEEVFEQIIRIKEMDLRRIQQNLENLSSNLEIPIMSVDQSTDEDSFSVLKDRHTIMATIESVVSEAESHVWLLLGRWGILHLLRSGAKNSVEDAISRGVDVKIVASVDKRTIRFFDGLDKKKVTPPEEVYERIKNENKLIGKARSINSNLVFFKEKFIQPLDNAIITGVYGSQRILNGKPRWPHYGLDFAGDLGTPIKAMADGIVTLAEKDLYYTGATLIFDHGHGISTLYMHMDKIFVEKDDIVKQGDIIGTVGSSGRSTGPHLDIRLNWFNVRLDPATVLEMN